MSKLFDSDNRYKTILICLLLGFVFLVSVVIIASNVSFKEEPEGVVAKVINEGELVINYNDGDKINISDGKTHKYNVSITNNSNKRAFYSMIIEKPNKEKISISVKDKEGNVVNKISKASDRLINLYQVESEETVRYVIEIKNNGKRFKGTLKIVNESLSTESFADLLRLHNPLSQPKTRIGSEIATLDEGLIETADNIGSSYYFRGNVKNNYFKLDDLMFRVVRINGDGSVRVVLDDVLGAKFAYNKNQIMAGTNATTLTLLNTASLNNELTKWFNSKLKNYNKYIVKGNYCTDTAYNLINNNIKYSITYERVFNDNAPDLFCVGNSYSMNVGLLSVDEVILAGASFHKPNDSYYLYNRNIDGNYFTTSTHSLNLNSPLMINIMSNGALGDGIPVTTKANIRPVINIGVNAKIKGNGTINNPYIIVS